MLIVELTDNNPLISVKQKSNAAPSPSDVKEMLLKWCRNKTKDYPVRK
jgi:hypothetical protein